ncbi:MAG: AbrB/MazE/SpoVT family DNA-binding domain-containing protein [Candidatus Heimdallarchaeaceae archaeon]
MSEDYKYKVKSSVYYINGTLYLRIPASIRDEFGIEPGSNVIVAVQKEENETKGLFWKE